MKGALGIGLLSLLVAFGCGKDSKRSPDPGDDAGNRASGGKNGGSGGRSTGGADPGDAATDGPASAGGIPGVDGSVDGGGTTGNGGSGSGGTSGAGGSGGQGGGPAKEPSTDSSKPVDLEANDVVKGTIPAGEHYWRIPTHTPGRFGLILRSAGAVTVGFSDQAEGGATSPGLNGCQTLTKGECGIRVDASFLTPGEFVTVFVFGEEGADYELELVPLTALAGTPPTTGFSQTVVYGTNFTGTMPSGEGAVTTSAPAKAAEIWRVTDSTTEWFTLGDFTCASRLVTFDPVTKTNVSNLTLGTSSYGVNNGNPTFPGAAGAAFTSAQSVPVSVTAGGTTTSTTLTAPTFTGEATASYDNEELLIEWLEFTADVAVLSFIAKEFNQDKQVTCREEDLDRPSRGGSRKAAAMREQFQKQIVARGWAIASLRMAVCGSTLLTPEVAAALFSTPAREVLLCQSIELAAAQLRSKF